MHQSEGLYVAHPNFKSMLWNLDSLFLTALIWVRLVLCNATYKYGTFWTFSIILFDFIYISYFHSKLERETVVFIFCLSCFCCQWAPLVLPALESVLPHIALHHMSAALEREKYKPSQWLKYPPLLHRLVPCPFRPFPYYF